mgnify:CR=1 FL=1
MQKRLPSAKGKPHQKLKRGIWLVTSRSKTLNNTIIISKIINKMTINPEHG